MVKVFIAGDCIFEPEPLRERLEATIGTKILDIRTKRFLFGETRYRINLQTPLPTGMAMEDPALIKRYPDCGVREFYGEPMALYDEIGDAEVLILHGAALPRKVIEHAKNLKAVISLRGGPVNVDTACLAERGIEFLNTVGKNAQAVAEFTLGALLDFERGYTYGNTQLKANWWWIKAIDPDFKSHELRGKTFGLIGYGQIARRLRQLLRGFDAKVCAYSPHVADADLENDNVLRVPLDELVTTSDYVSLHTRAKSCEPPLMNARLLALMRPDAVLINSARGGLLDYVALKDVLAQRKLRGAVLDVLGGEPFGTYQKLIQLPNAFVTPHIAGMTVETVERGYRQAGELLGQYLKDSGKLQH